MINYNQNTDREFEIACNTVFKNEFSDINIEEEGEDEELYIIKFNGLYFNNEPKKTSKEIYNIGTNFTSKKIHNIQDLEVKITSPPLLPPSESNLEFQNKNENEILVEEEKDKKFYEEFNFINKKRKELENYNISEENKKIGRKNKKSGKTGHHNKYSEDNIRRKIILMILNIVLDYCNIQISKFGKLLKINSEQKKRAKVLFSKNLLNKPLKEIFSENISEKFSKFEKNHNKILITNLLNVKDETKKIEFEDLFNLTFSDCLKHFIGIKFCPKLSNMILFEEACKKYEKYDDYQDYKIILEYYTKYFEKIISLKKQRNRKSKNS